MLIVLAVLFLVSFSWNYHYFYIENAPDPKARSEQYAREMEADPLFSDTAVYETLRSGSTSNPTDSGNDGKQNATRPADSSRSTKELVRAHVRKRILAEHEALERAQKELLFIAAEETLNAELRVGQSGTEFQHVFLQIATNEPQDLDLESYVSGKQRVWLRGVEADLISKNQYKDRVEFSGKAKAYVESQGKRVRTVLDVVVNLKKNKHGTWIANFSIKRGVRTANKYPYVQRDGRDFAINIQADAHLAVPVLKEPTSQIRQPI